MDRVLTVDAGFYAASDPQQFMKFHSSDPISRCEVNVTVDDWLIPTDNSTMRDALLGALTTKFGQLTVNLETSVHAGVEFHRLPDGGVRLTQDTSIARAESLVGRCGSFASG